jgi:hypothetical protein
MADVECAIALDTNNAPAYLGRGLVYKARNQNAEALEDFNKAIALAPDNSEGYQSAIGDFTAASGLEPQQAEPLLARAQSYLALDKPKEAATSTRWCRMSRRTRKPGSREASPTSGSATRPGPPAPMAAPSICVPGTRRRVPALPASAASLGRATIRSDCEAVRFEATARQSANCWRPPFPFCSCSLGKTAWNIDLAAANTSWATVVACDAALAASARRSSRGRGGGISAGGIGRFGSSTGTEAV